MRDELQVDQGPLQFYSVKLTRFLTSPSLLHVSPSRDIVGHCIDRSILSVAIQKERVAVVIGTGL